MAVIHYSYPMCDDCGERHRIENKEDCVEVLKQRVQELERQIEELEDTILSINDPDY